MSSKNVTSQVVSVDEQAFENADEAAVDEDGFEVVDETPAFQATVQMETQAKVDANHPDGMVDSSDERIYGATLEQEERIRAREAELECISAKAELGTQEGRERRTREIAAKRSAERRAEFQKRAASVDPWVDPERDDPRAELAQEQLAAVNTQSIRLAEKLDGWSRAAIGRRLGEAVVGGKDLMSAVVGVFEELETAPGQVVPIGKIEEVNRKEVSIEGRVSVLWEPSSPAISQVGLIEDESGKTKFTSWMASDQPWIEEGERVRIHQLLPVDFEPTSRVLKRAQYESFEFSLLDGDIRVRNESHENPATHEYLVTIVDGIPATCECPADATYEGPCKHRVAVAIRPRILKLVTKVQVVADGGTRVTDHYEPDESDQCECDELNEGFPCWECVRTGRKTLPEK